MSVERHVESIIGLLLARFLSPTRTSELFGRPSAVADREADPFRGQTIATSWKQDRKTAALSAMIFRGTADGSG
jgi:hypothetical protein